jgi:uncharacterized protein (DUF433 family)
LQRVEKTAAQLDAKQRATNAGFRRNLIARVDEMACLDWSQCPAVESVPGKVSGAWVFRGTRMPVQTVFANLQAGMSVKEITEVFDVTPDEVEAVVRFVTESLEKEPAFG